MIDFVAYLIVMTIAMWIGLFTTIGIIERIPKNLSGNVELLILVIVMALILTLAKIGGFHDMLVAFLI